MRVYVYVDGFNLYYRALKNTKHKWLNIPSLAARLLDPSDTIEMVRYFTARVKPRPTDRDAPRRQQIYLSALDSEPTVTLHYGKFLKKKIFRPLVSDPKKFVEVHDTEEKGSDVNLATHLVNDGWHDRYDTALIMSQDTDLVEPLRIVREELKKDVGLVWLDGKQANGALVRASSFVRHVTRADLAASQFPDPVIRLDGKKIPKLHDWK